MAEQTVKLRNGKTITVKAESAPVEMEQVTCGACTGMGLCSCDCGHEHDCGECNGKGYTEKHKAVHFYEETVEETAAKAHFEKLIRARYDGSYTKQIADFWTHAAAGLQTVGRQETAQ